MLRSTCSVFDRPDVPCRCLPVSVSNASCRFGGGRAQAICKDPLVKKVPVDDENVN